MRLDFPKPRLQSLIVFFVAPIFLGRLGAEQPPVMRPAFFAPGSQSLVNLIDTEALLRKGQRDAWVMFSCGVLNDGLVAHSYGIVAFRASAGADLLKK